jgi:hypothetical protein
MVSSSSSSSSSSSECDGCSVLYSRAVAASGAAG